MKELAASSALNLSFSVRGLLVEIRPPLLRLVVLRRILIRSSDSSLLTLTSQAGAGYSRSLSASDQHKLQHFNLQSESNIIGELINLDMQCRML